MRFSPMSLTLTRVLGLGVVTALLAALPSVTQGTPNFGLMLLVFVTTIITLNIRAPLHGIELSAAHGPALLLLFGLPPEAQGVSLWTLTVAGAVGEIIYQARRRQPQAGDQRVLRRTGAHVVLVCAALTFSFSLTTFVLRLLNVHLPIPVPNFAQLLAVTIGAIILTLTYYIVRLSEVVLNHSNWRAYWRVTLARDALPAFILLILPIVLAIGGASIYNTQRAEFSALYFTFMLLTINAPALIISIQRQLRQQVQTLSVLASMSSAIRANLNDQALLNVIYEQVRALIHIESLYVALVQDQYVSYPLVIHEQQPVTHLGESLEAVIGTPFHRVFMTGEPLLIEQNAARVTSAWGLRLPQSTIEAWMGAPLLRGDACIGALVITSQDPLRRFTSDDLRLLTIAAATTSTALENADLYAQQRARVSQMMMLNQVLTLLNNTLSPDVVIDTVISSASMVAEADAVAVYLYWDDARSTLALVRSAGFSSEASAALPDPLLSEALVTRRIDQLAPLVINDVQRDERAHTIRATMLMQDVRAWIELPLSFGGVGMGVLTVYYTHAREFAPELIELLRTFAAQSAQAIYNARLYTITDEELEQRVGQLLALAQLGSELTATMSLVEICDQALDLALAVTGSSAGALFLGAASDQAYELLVSRGYPSDLVQANLTASNSLTRRALNSGSVVIEGDVSTNPHYLTLLEGMNAQISIPLLRAGQVIGGLTLEHSQPHAFDDDDAHFISQLANQTGIALQNARLFREISEANEQMRVILNAMQEPLMLISPEGATILANPRIEALGIEPQRLLTHTIYELEPRADAEGDLLKALGFPDWDALKRLLTFPEQETASTAYELHHPDGVRHIERQAIAVRDDDGRLIGALLVFYDHTERVELDQAREEFSRMLVHDLRSPLAAVMTSLRLLSDIAPLDSNAKPMVEITANAGRSAITKLLHRIDAILDVAKLEDNALVLDTEPISLHVLVENVFNELNALARESRIKLSADLDGLPPLDADADKVERVLLNLLDNALKFSPQGGSVTVRAHTLDSSGFAQIDVIDTGPGVPNEYKTRLFERFVQVRGQHGSRRGSGLGLTFCRLVVEAHGGSIWIDDNPTGGSIFAFTLPAAKLSSGDSASIMDIDQLS